VRSWWTRSDGCALRAADHISRMPMQALSRRQKPSTLQSLKDRSYYDRISAQTITSGCHRSSANGFLNTHTGRRVGAILHSAYPRLYDTASVYGALLAQLPSEGEHILS